MVPTLLLDIVSDVIYKEQHEWEMPHVQAERNQSNPTQYGPLKQPLEPGRTI